MGFRTEKKEKRTKEGGHRSSKSHGSSGGGNSGGPSQGVGKNVNNNSNSNNKTNWRASLRLKDPLPLEKDNKDRLLLDAAGRGEVDKVTALLEDGANHAWCNNFGQSAIHWAAGHGHAECLRILLQHNADVDALTGKKWTPMHYAAYNGIYLLPHTQHATTQLKPLITIRAH